MHFWRMTEPEVLALSLPMFYEMVLFMRAHNSK